MRNDKRRIVLITIATCLMLGTSLLYGYIIVLKGKMNLGSTIPFFIALMAGVFMAFFIQSRYRDIKEGMPLEDERSRKVMTQAAATTFYVSVYWLLFISLFESFFAGMSGVEKLDASQVAGIGIGGMTIVFIVSWLYYNRKDKLV